MFPVFFFYRIDKALHDLMYNGEYVDYIVVHHQQAAYVL